MDARNDHARRRGAALEIRALARRFAGPSAHPNAKRRVLTLRGCVD